MRKSILFFIGVLTVAIQSNAQQYNFKDFTINDGVPESRINTIGEDQRGNLWIGTSGNGLLKFDGYTFVNFSTEDGLISDVIYSVYEDNKGLIWLGTDRGICTY